MTILAADVLAALKGKTLATAESCTGGGIGASLTAVPGSSAIYKGGIISYTNEVKEWILEVDSRLLSQQGAVSAPVAQQMAEGARRVLNADVSVSVTGLAGPGGDAYGNPVGTVYIGYADEKHSFSRCFFIDGDRQVVREQACRYALGIILEETF